MARAAAIGQAKAKSIMCELEPRRNLWRKEGEEEANLEYVNTIKKEAALYVSLDPQRSWEYQDF